jgi:hypothetical protein
MDEPVKAPSGLKAKEPHVKSITIADPFTHKTLCSIRNPKTKVKEYTNEGKKCIDLRDLNCAPDFGFDAEDPI